VKPAPGPRSGRAPGEPSRGVALGYLAMLPLLLAYEAVERGGLRNVGEAVATWPLGAFGGSARLARVLALLALAVLAIVALARSGLGREGPGLLPRAWRILLEGGAAALLLGPALLLLLDLLGGRGFASELRFPATRAPTLGRSAFLAGGAAWEEIVFRIGVQSLLFLLAGRFLAFLTGSPRLARIGAEILSIGLSSTAFAASHLASFTRALGPGGEPFVASVFTWRLLAGILLGALFRWRGPGVAAWAHALFDLCLSIGAGPDVFL
jgi:hypothetical protein